MAKKKTVHPLDDGSYGKIIKKMASGMFLTSKGQHVPPFAGLKTGDEVIMEDGKYKIGDGKSEEIDTAQPMTAQEAKEMRAKMQELEEKNKKLEEKFGELGSKGDNDA